MTPNPFAPFVGPFLASGDLVLDADDRVVVIIDPNNHSASLRQRITRKVRSLLNAEWERVQKENSAKRADEIANRRLNQIFGEKENQKEEKV